METVLKIVAVGVGGSLGAIARYLINISPVTRVFTKFPLPTLMINIAGSFLIGFLVVLLADKYVVGDNFRLAIIVGFLGAFTTFSTFEMEMYGLVRDGEMTVGLIYFFLSVLVGFVAVALGVVAARQF